MTIMQQDMQRNLEEIEANISKACEHANRPREEVQLIAVSKTKPINQLQVAYDLGCRHFGENKVQELMDKIPALPEDIKWHMIGHLQTNKVKYLIGKVACIHSVDSLKLAKEISKESVKKQVTTDILVEINVAGEESKFGSSNAEENRQLLEDITKLPGICLKGLMTIAPFTEEPESNRKYFRELKAFAKANQEFFAATPVLSMGMSGDYGVAIEEGATFVRVGTSLFGARNY